MPQSMPKQTTNDDLELLGELGLDTVPDPIRQHSVKEERIIAGFELLQQQPRALPDRVSVGKNASEMRSIVDPKNWTGS